MPNHNHANVNPPARTHAEAAALFRRPFAPGAIGFRAMTKVAYNGQPYAGAQVAAYIGAQSVDPAAERGRARPLAPAVPNDPGRVRPGRQPAGVPRLPADRHPPGRGGRARRRRRLRGPRRDGLRLVRRLKALYSDARKRAAVAAGIGAYLYTSLEAVVLPIGPHARQVQAIRRQGKSDLLVLSPETEQWLRHGYQTRMSTEAVRRDLGEILAHGEPENGIGQGEVADQAAQPTGEPPAAEPASPASNGHGEVVTVDFGDLGPAAA